MDGMPVIAGAALLAVSCAPPVSKGGFDAPDPASRIYATRRAAESGDVAATPRIVELLDSDDPAVRMTAIAALQKLWGETYGYRYDDPPYVREAAVKRWVEAAESSRTLGHKSDG